MNNLATLLKSANSSIQDIGKTSGPRFHRQRNLNHRRKKGKFFYCGKVMFLHLSVSHSVHGGGSIQRAICILLECFLV